MSTSYIPLPCNDHELCLVDQCLGKHCTYNAKYDDGTHSFGILAHETFTFEQAHTHGLETAKIVIGCDIHNKLNFEGKLFNEQGVLGMSWDPHSFVNQIASHSQGRFSYCLPSLHSNERLPTPTVLRFGQDTPVLHNLNILSLQQYPIDKHYYVKLEGISINTTRLYIPYIYFMKTRQGHGGCIFDTGFTYTTISEFAFKILKDVMIRYLRRVDTTLKMTRSQNGLDLCYWQYHSSEELDFLPSITFHFEGGVDLVNQRDIAFVTWRKNLKRYVCMAILPTSEKNIAFIGAHSQANHVFVYDLPSKKLYFGPRDCARNP